jgi:putative heme-binding domain-containing protein
MRQALSDRAADPAKRQSAMDALLSVKDPTLPATLQKLLDDPHIANGALRGLAQYDDANTPKAILDAYPSLDRAQKKDALTTMASRTPYAQSLLNAIGKQIPAVDVSADVVRQLRSLHDANLDKQVTKVWGVLRESPQDKVNRIAQLQKILERPDPAPDASHGRFLFQQTCSQCHTLYDVGGKVGPDITGSNRHDLKYLLENVVDPNAVIPNDYRTTMIDTTDGRTILGIVKKEDANAVSIQTATELLVVPRPEIKTQRLTPQSMMPEGILDNFAEKDVRDLIAYLRTDKQVPLPPAEGAAAAGGARP